MSAIRLRETDKGLEVRVDDETPIGDEPIEVNVLPGHISTPTYVALTIQEARELRDALSAAIAEAVDSVADEKRNT